MKKEIVRMKGKISMSSLLLSIILIASIQSTAASSTAKINVNPSYLEVDVGEAFAVDINITNVETPGVYAYEFKLYYNTTLLNATKAEYPAGHFLDGGPKFEVPVNATEANIQGYLLFGVTLLGDLPGKTGNGTLATISFTGLGVGVSPLQIREVTLLDPNGDSPEYSGTDGVVKIIPELTALMMFVFMTITLAAVMLKKHNASKKHNVYL